MARATDRHAEPFGDITQGQILEAGQLERGALPGRQLIEAAVQNPSAFVGRQARRPLRSAVVERFDPFASIGGAAAERSFAPERAVIDVLQQPHPYRSALGRKQVRLPIDLEKDLLGHVFGFRAVAQNAVRDAADQTSVTLDKRREGVRVVGADVVEQFGIRARARLG
jgi:hypothetical protein